MPSVSAEGELFLRRRPGHDDGPHRDSRYPFAHGLTFVARRWRNIMNEELQAVGQSHARWGTLFWIDVFGDRINQTQLADRMGVEQPTLGRILHKLELDGLIERRASSRDLRARVIRLTPASASLMKRINHIQNTVRASLLRGIDPSELASCLEVFAKILDNMDRHTTALR
ncbi:MAG TPA: MarR family transcriptional regulator [Steroidobacteraceae bacterium]|nr:MarR family transcriptional regulator [Steroidobacteraceae bacterium]